MGAMIRHGLSSARRFGIVEVGLDYIRRLDTSFVAGGLAMVTPGGAWQALAG